MKKLILSLAVLAAAITVASCATSAKKAGDEGEAIKAKIENCTDPDSLKIYAAEAQAYADKLVKEGNDAAAKVYLDEVAPAIQAKDPSAATVFDRLKNEADSAVAAAAEKADTLASKAKDKAEELKDKAVDAKDKVADKTKEVVDKSKDAVSNAADKSKEAVSDAAQKSADKVKDVLGK